MSHTPRIPPVMPPYAPDVDAALRAMMPRNSPIEPLKAFRTFVQNPALAAAMLPLGQHVLGKGRTIDLRDREILIDRVCARCGCEYEWGVHASFFAERAALTPEQLAATVTGDADAPVWSARDALLVRLVDELHDTSQVSDRLWDALAAHWTQPQLLELLLVVGWYHTIAFLLNGFRVEREEWAAVFPT
jgi:4-carboxymuconolactone decarboxylase